MQRSQEFSEKVAATTTEVELRFQLSELPSSLSPGQEITQGLLLKEEGVSVRIRKTQDSEDPMNAVSYSMTTKYGKGMARKEYSCPIDESCFIALLEHIQEGTLQQKHRRFRDRWVIDEIKEGHEAGEIIAEYELNELESEPIPPEDFDVVQRKQ